MQLTLGVTLRDDATFENFYLGRNQELVTALQGLSVDDAERFIYLWGSVGSGRSHLLQACCHAFTQEGKRAIYLPLSEMPSITPDILQGLEEMDLICIDDIEAVLGQADWEEALMHFYNRVRDIGARLLISASSAPMHLPCQLADLQSRLCWGLIFQIEILNDEEKIAALQMRSDRRGLALSFEVGQYVLRRCPRDTALLFDVLDRLDQASLAAQRRLTIPFVKQALENDFNLS